MSQNSSNEEIFNATRHEYEDALKKSGHPAALKFSKQKKLKPHNRHRNIIWFNPPFSKTVSTNVAKNFLQLIDKHFPRTHKMHKIFNRNTIKVSYSCTENISRIIKAHNKRVSSKSHEQTSSCNCRNKNECPMDGKCQITNAIYKCNVVSPSHPEKVYIGLAEGEWKKRYYNHTKSFKHKRYSHETTLSSYVWYIKETSKETPTLKWSVLKCVRPYSNTSKKCLLCLHEKLAIITHPNQNELLNKRSELLCKCRHENKYLLKYFNTND